MLEKHLNNTLSPLRSASFSGWQVFWDCNGDNSFKKICVYSFIFILKRSELTPGGVYQSSHSVGLCIYGGHLNINGDSEQWKMLICCCVPHRFPSSLKCRGTVVGACPPGHVCQYPKEQWFLLTGCIIDHKRCRLAEPRRDSGTCWCPRDIDWVNGSFVAASV